MLGLAFWTSLAAPGRTKSFSISIGKLATSSPSGFANSVRSSEDGRAGWGHPAVHWIISNPTYVATIRWRDRIFDAYEPLVDELTFRCAQAILRERGEDISRRRGKA
jgi:hypothetical protein